MDIDDLLGYAFSALPYAAVVAIAIGLIALLLGLYRNPLVGAVAVLGVTVWEAAAYELDPFQLGIYIYPLDMVFACIALVVLLRIAFAPGAARSVPRPLILLLALMALSATIGLARFGTKAGVEFRGDFYLWAGCLYLVTFRPEQVWLDRLLSWWMFAAVLLCTIVCYRWAADALDLTWFEPIWRDDDYTGVAFNRVAPSEVAFALGLAVLVSIATIASGRAGSVHFVLLPSLLMIIVLLQHRSVWVATLLPMLFLLMLLRGATRQSARLPLLAAVASIVIVAAALGSGAMQGAESSVAEQAVSATSTTSGTFVARVDGWRQLLGQWSGSGPVGLAIGQPYGSGFERYQGGNWGGTEVTYAPHNYFVSILLRTGLLGLAAFAFLIWGLFRDGLVRSDTSARFGPPLVGAITASVVLFSIPYRPTTASGLLLGAALCYAYGLRGAATRRQDATVEGALPAEGRADDQDHSAVPKLAQARHGNPS